ncbi:MAG: glycosyltransferase family 9 protein [Candidatus Margulisiibacteriota bacterium]
MRQIDPSQIKKILVIRPDAIGDLVLTTPAISALRSKYPQAHIAVLAREYNQIVIKNNPAVDEIIIDDLYDRIYNRQRIGLSLYRQWIKRLRQKEFDIMINFCGEFPYALIAFLAGIPYRIGDKGKVLYSWLYNFPIFQRFSSWAIHEVEHNFELLKPLGIKMTNTPKLRIYPGKEAVSKGIKLIEENGLKGKKLIMVNIGTGGGNKPWNIENFKELIRILSNKYNTKIILLGGPKEKAIAETILPEMKHQILNLVGLPLEILIGLLSQMHLYIGNDTGPTHMAVALQVPSIVLYIAKYQKPGRWAPWATPHKIIKKVLDCPYPCRPSICKKDLCTREISPQEVALAAFELLSGKGLISPEEQKLERERLSFNILLIGSGPRKEKIARILKENDLRFWAMSIEEAKKMSIKKLLDRYSQYDINILQIISQSCFKLRLSALLTSLSMPIPVLHLADEGREFNNITSLLNYYQGKLSQ